jgi:hypothetical protein
MMSWLDESDVQTWLEGTKLPVEYIEPGIETQCKDRIFGVLAARYNTAVWTSRTSSPALVVQLVAMSYAAVLYRRQYSEDLDTTPAWPQWLESSVTNSLSSIMSGDMDLLDSAAKDNEINNPQHPVFYPTDASDLDDPRAFTMGKVF